MKQTKPRFNCLLRSSAWKWSGDYCGRKGRDGQKTKIGKANEKRTGHYTWHSGNNIACINKARTLHQAQLVLRNVTIHR